MDNDRIYIGRKRIVFVEKIPPSYKENPEIISTLFGLPLFLDMEFLRKNRFVIEMQNDNKTLNTKNIQGFSITNFKDKEKIIRINTTIHVNDWISDYDKVNIIKVFLLDALGNSIREFDFDVSFKGYTFDCDYREDALMVPCFTYKIVE